MTALLSGQRRLLRFSVRSLLVLLTGLCLWLAFFSKVTDKGLSDLRKAMPNCEIDTGDGGEREQLRWLLLPGDVTD